MANEPTFPAVQAYRALDLGADSRAVQDLMSSVDREARKREITLLGDGDAGSLSNGLTPEMSAWLGSYVSPPRQAALSELEDAARRITLGRNCDGVLEEIESDKLKRNRVQRRQQTYSEFHDNHGAQLIELEQLELEYDRMRVRANRDATVPNRLLEWGILFPVVLIPEMFLNFESFRQTPIVGSDAMALGITLIVGVAIAVAAHVLGSFSKQFNYYMRPDHPERQGDGLRKLAWGATLLLAALAAVGAARYYYLLPLRMEAIILGQEPPSMFTQIGGSVIGNIVVFLIGAVITYLMEDPDPEFSRKKRMLDRMRKQVERLRKEHIVKKLAEIDRAFRRDGDDVKALAQQMNGKPGYADVRAQFSNLLAKDAEVESCLRRYRSALVERLQERDEDVRIDQPYIGAERGGERRRISLADFAALPMQLYKA